MCMHSVFTLSLIFQSWDGPESGRKEEEGRDEGCEEKLLPWKEDPLEAFKEPKNLAPGTLAGWMPMNEEQRRKEEEGSKGLNQEVGQFLSLGHSCIFFSLSLALQLLAVCLLQENRFTKFCKSHTSIFYRLKFPRRDEELNEWIQMTKTSIIITLTIMIMKKSHQIKWARHHNFLRHHLLIRVMK